MGIPSEELASILAREAAGWETGTETFWRIIFWAGGDGVTDEDVRSLPERWQRRIVEDLTKWPSTRHAHPNYLRHALPGEWTEARMQEARTRRDRGIALLVRVLRADPTCLPADGPGDQQA